MRMPLFVYGRAELFTCLPAAPSCTEWLLALSLAPLYTACSLPGAGAGEPQEPHKPSKLLLSAAEEGRREREERQETMKEKATKE